LCEISSDLSSADEKKFIEKNKSFWSLKKHYFRIEYSVRVLIGPADLRFELWFDDQKLSRDQSIKVEWTPPTQTPAMAAGPADHTNSPNYGAFELADRRQTAGSGFNSGMDRSPDKTKRGMGGFLTKASGGKWTVHR
jgi:hypothetical protein